MLIIIDVGSYNTKYIIGNEKKSFRTFVASGNYQEQIKKIDINTIEIDDHKYFYGNDVINIFSNIKNTVSGIMFYPIMKIILLGILAESNAKEIELIFTYRSYQKDEAKKLKLELEGKQFKVIYNGIEKEFFIKKCTGKMQPIPIYQRLILQEKISYNDRITIIDSGGDDCNIATIRDSYIEAQKDIKLGYNRLLKDIAKEKYMTLQQIIKDFKYCSDSYLKFMDIYKNRFSNEYFEYLEENNIAGHNKIYHSGGFDLYRDLLDDSIVSHDTMFDLIDSIQYVHCNIE